MPHVTEIVLAGCDYLMHPKKIHPCPEWGHDSTGEHRACAALFKLIDIEDLDG
jgi:hypothetical protein